MLIRAARFLLLCLMIAAFLSACSGAAPTQSPSATVPQTSPSAAATRAPIATGTPFPTETSRPSLTPLPTLTFTPGPTATPTPDAALSQVKLLGMAWNKNYTMLLSFQFPGPVEVSQYRVTLEEKDFNCQKVTKYPDRLYCTGPGGKVLTYAMIRIYPAGSSTPGFEDKRWIPYFDNDYNNQFLPPY